MKQRMSPPTKRGLVIPPPQSTILSIERKSAIRAQTLRNNVLNERKSAVQEIQKINLLKSPKSKSKSALSLSPKINVSAAVTATTTTTTDVSHVVVESIPPIPQRPHFSPSRPSLPPPPKPLAPASPIRPVRELVEIYESKTDEIALKMTMLPPRSNPLFDAATLATQPAPRIIVQSLTPPPPQPPPTTTTDWITIKSSSSGLEYFFNPKTGISQWESPHTSNNTQQAPPLLRAIDDPKEWTIRATREGIPFYECVSAGVVTWARPTALHPLNIIGSAPEVYSFPSSAQNINSNRNDSNNNNSHHDFLISQMLGKI